MRLYFLCLILISIVACKEKFDDTTYQSNKQSLADKEQTHPQQFLKITADDKKNLLEQRL